MTRNPRQGLPLEPNAGMERRGAGQGGVMGSGPEMQIVNAILHFLKLRRIPAWRINSGQVKTQTGSLFRGAPAGTADVLLALPMTISGKQVAIFGAIEVKAPKGDDPTPNQEAFLAMVREAGGIAFVARSVDDVQQALEAFEEERRVTS